MANAKNNLSQMSDEASKAASDAKSTATNLFDHAKGAANAAMVAGSKAAENIVDQKLKEAEHVSPPTPQFSTDHPNQLFVCVCELIRLNYPFNFRHLMLVYTQLVVQSIKN